jgi:tetratricopeptide (TPR) repeat protein
VIAARLASAIGLSEAPASTDEIIWAVRRTLEVVARRHPLVVIVEDIHWAEPNLLDLLRDLASVGDNVPVLLVCLARPDLLDRAPEWADPAPGRSMLMVEALPGSSARLLADAVAGDHVIPPTLRDRILATAEGNPLFVEEMVRLAIDDAAARSGDRDTAAVLDSQLPMPPTIQALLAARLDRLPEHERSAAQRGAVAGRVFEEPAVVAMSPGCDEAEVARSLGGLVRREFLTSQRSDVSTGAAFRFRHILIRDAAYEALPKTERAFLHERFGDWLERVAGERIGEFEEIVGYHLAEAHRYRTELRDRSEQNAALAARAAAHLRAAAGRARDRGDAAGAAEMLVRAIGLSQADRSGLAQLTFEHARALLEAGRLPEATAQVDAALRHATSLGNRRLAAEARLLAVDIKLQDGSLVDADEAVGAEIEAAHRDAEASGDARALSAAWQMLGGRAYMTGRFSEASIAWRNALDFARRSGDVRRALESQLNLLVAAVVDATPAAQVLSFGEDVVEDLADYPLLRADALRLVAVMEAMVERFDPARAHAEASVSILREFDRRSEVVVALGDQSWVLRLAGDVDGAERVLREGFSLAVAGRDRTARSWIACRLAQLLVEEDRLAEAEQFVAEAELVPIAMNRTRVVGARARLQAAAGDSAADEALQRLLLMIEDLSQPNIAIDGLLDAAAVAAVRGRSDEARRHADGAFRLAEAKGNIPRARQIKMFLEALPPGAGAELRSP